MTDHCLLRSSDGLTLYAVSSDGTMAVFSFDREELEGIAPASAQEVYLKKFGFTPPPLPEGYSHQPKEEDTRMTPPPSPRRTPAPAQTQDLGFGLTSNGGEHVNKLVAKRKTQKRGQPSFGGSLGGSVPSASTVVPSASTSNAATTPSRTTGRSFHEIAGIVPSRPPASSMLLSAPEPYPSVSAFGGSRGVSEALDLELAYPEEFDMNTEVSISSLDMNGKGKRKSTVMDSIDDRPSKARTLGGDRPRDTVTIKEIAPPSTSMVVYDAVTTSSAQSLAARLPMAPLLSYLKASVEGSEDLFEARNSEDSSMCLCWSLGSRKEHLTSLLSQLHTR
jgi:protein HIRA/HIR1